MAEQHLRQDQHGCYYWADAEPEQAPVYTAAELALTTGSVQPMSQETVKALREAIDAAEAEVTAAIGMPAAAPAKRTRSPRKATLAPAQTPVSDAVTIPPPPPIMRG